MKTEKEKMLAGEMYNPHCEELIEDRARAKDLCYKYNNLAPQEGEKKKLILKELLQTDKAPYIEPNFYCDRMKVCSQTSWTCPEKREDGIEF